MDHEERHGLFVELLTEHRRQLFGYIYALLRNFADTEDVYQQTAIVLWQKFEQFHPDTSFLSWSCQVAQFEVRNFIRRRQRDRLYFDDDVQEALAATQSAIVDSDGEERQEALMGCIEKLPREDRQLIEDCYGGSKSFKQVAEKLGRKPKSIYDALGRIRRVLARCIERTLAQGDSK